MFNYYKCPINFFINIGNPYKLMCPCLQRQAYGTLTCRVKISSTGILCLLAAGKPNGTVP